MSLGLAVFIILYGCYQIFKVKKDYQKSLWLACIILSAIVVIKKM